MNSEMLKLQMKTIQENYNSLTIPEKLKEISEYVNENYYAVKFNAEGNKEVNFKGNNSVQKQFNDAREELDQGLNLLEQAAEQFFF